MGRKGSQKVRQSAASTRRLLRFPRDIYKSLRFHSKKDGVSRDQNDKLHPRHDFQFDFFVHGSNSERTPRWTWDRKSAAASQLLHCTAPFGVSCKVCN